MIAVLLRLKIPLLADTKSLYLIQKQAVNKALCISKKTERDAGCLKLLSTSLAPISCHQSIPSKPAFFLL